MSTFNNTCKSAQLSACNCVEAQRWLFHVSSSCRARGTLGMLVACFPLGKWAEGKSGWVLSKPWHLNVRALSLTDRPAHGRIDLCREGCTFLPSLEVLSCSFSWETAKHSAFVQKHLMRPGFHGCSKWGGRSAPLCTWKRAESAVGQGRAFATCARWKFPPSQPCPVPLLCDILPTLGHGTRRFQGHVAVVARRWQEGSDPSAAAARAEVSERVASAVAQLVLAHVVQEADPRTEWR